MASNWIGRAKNGEPPFPQPIDIRMAAPMNAGPLFFITRADSTVRSVADLRGRRVAVGMETSGTVQHAHNIFRVLGLSFSDFTPVYHDFAAGAEALVAGEVDAQFSMSDPQQGDDRVERARRGARSALRARGSCGIDEGRVVLSTGDDAQSGGFSRT